VKQGLKPGSTGCLFRRGGRVRAFCCLILLHGFAEAWDEEGKWWASEPPRTVWFFSVSATDQRRPPAAQEMLSKVPLEGAGERLQYRRDELIGQAVLNRAEGGVEGYWHLCARSAVPGHVANCHLFFEDLADRQWAIDTWHSLEHQEEVWQTRAHQH
jgi:hypothetical protein